MLRCSLGPLLAGLKLSSDHYLPAVSPVITSVSGVPLLFDYLSQLTTVDLIHITNLKRHNQLTTVPPVQLALTKDSSNLKDFLLVSKLILNIHKLEYIKDPFLRWCLSCLSCPANMIEKGQVTNASPAANKEIQHYDMSPTANQQAQWAQRTKWVHRCMNIWTGQYITLYVTHDNHEQFMCSTSVSYQCMNIWIGRYITLYVTHDNHEQFMCSTSVSYQCMNIWIGWYITLYVTHDNHEQFMCSTSVSYQCMNIWTGQYITIYVTHDNHEQFIVSSVSYHCMSNGTGQYLSISISISLSVIVGYCPVDWSSLSEVTSSVL